MLNWIVEKYFYLISFVPRLWPDELSGSFPLVRGMLGILLLVLLIGLIVSVLRMRLGRGILQYFRKTKK